MKEEILKVLKEKSPYIRKKYHVKSIGLFDSCVRGEEKKESDIDILIEFEKPIGLFKFMELEEYLSQKLGRKVDLVEKDALKERIKPYVMEEVVYV